MIDLSLLTVNFDVAHLPRERLDGPHPKCGASSVSEWIVLSDEMNLDRLSHMLSFGRVCKNCTRIKEAT